MGETYQSLVIATGFFPSTGVAAPRIQKSLQKFLGKNSKLGTSSLSSHTSDHDSSLSRHDLEKDGWKWQNDQNGTHGQKECYEALHFKARFFYVFVDFCRGVWGHFWTQTSNVCEKASYHFFAGGGKTDPYKSIQSCHVWHIYPHGWLIFMGINGSV